MITVLVNGLGERGAFRDRVKSKNKKCYLILFNTLRYNLWNKGMCSNQGKGVATLMHPCNSY